VTLRIVIADDQALVRAGFRKLLEGEGGIEVAGEAADGQQAIELCQLHRPDVVLMDIRMPVMDGITATKRIVADGRTRVLILTTYDLDEYVFAALTAGASGFLLKDSPPDDLVVAIKVVAGGEALLAPRVTRRLINEFVALRPALQDASAASGRLTHRERQVLPLIAQGLSNAEIARQLHLGETTVKSHVAAILQKLGVRDRIHAVVFAYETGLVRPGAS
jgi:DNA-binding NarL/FixJ family response regulator